MSNARPERWEAPGEGKARAGPTPEFWRYLWFPAVFSVAALLLRQELVFLLGALVVGCGAAAYPLCRANLRGVAVKRDVPPRARVGVPATLTYAVENDGKRAAAGLDVEDRPHRTAHPGAVKFEVPCLGAGRRVTGQAQVTFGRRGRLDLAAPRLSSRFPLGVFRCVAAPGVPDELLVRPREGRPTAALLRRLRGRAREQSVRLTAARGSDALFGVREFRDGDDPRRIHWRSSARRGQPLVADWRAEDGLEVLLVLARQPERGTARAFERAVSVTATVWRTLHRLGRPCRLLLGTPADVGGTGARVFGAGLDALALVKPSAGRRPLAAVRRLAQHAHPRAVVVVTSGEEGEALAAARAAAGPGGDAWVLRADGPERARFVGGDPVSRVRALPLLAAGAAALGVVLAARVPEYHPAFAAAFGTALLWRLGLGRDGRRLLPRRVLAAVLATLVAVGVTMVMTTASAVGARPPLPPLLETLTALATVALLAKLDAFGAFWLVLLSSTHAAGACYVGRDVTSLLLVPLYVAWLAATLVVLERAVTAERRTAQAESSRVLVDPGSSPPRVLGAAVGRLVALGFLAGLAVWFVAPRPGPPERKDGRSASAPFGFREMDEAGLPIQPEHGREIAFTGADESADGVVLGTVGKIQEDNTVHFEVRLVSGDGGPTILLREDVLDVWEDDPDPKKTQWRSTTAARLQRRAPRVDGWVAFDRPRRDEPVRDLAITLRANRQRVFLEPDALGFRVTRPEAVDEEGAGRGPFKPITEPFVLKGNGQIRSGIPLLKGDVIEQRSMPQPRGGGALLGNLSDAEVSPLPSYVHIEPGLAARLRRLAEGVPEIASKDPWRRAQALERWLKSPHFTYELASPALAPGRRVEDFLSRVRKGNCEWFATGLTLLLRAHGLPARYVRGYWGGSHTLETNLWTFYGTHYHAWCELYLHGVGWVPLNPTPPERLAEGADPKTRESGRRTQTEEAEGGWADGASGFRRWLADRFERWILAPIRSVFGPEGLVLVAVALACVAAGLFLWRRRRATGVGGAEAVREANARGPYAQALRLLARKGFVRRREWTAREFLARIRALLPPSANRAFERLTGQHEWVRYGGRRMDAAAARADLAALEQAFAARA